MKNRVRSNKGMIGTDALIAVAILALFSGIIATLMYNIYSVNTSLKRMSQATNYITDVFEYIDTMYYDDVTEGNLKDYIRTKYQNGDSESTNPIIQFQGDDLDNRGYIIRISISPYNAEIDLVKTITMHVTYEDKYERYPVKQMTRIKRRENLITPNAPDISPQEGKNIYPIKLLKGDYYVTEQNDINWYNYHIGNWPLVLVTTKSNLKIGDVITLTDSDNIIVWIPRYTYDSEGNIKPLYLTTNYYVEENNGIKTLSQEQLDWTRANTNELGMWVSITEAQGNQLNNLYPIKNVNVNNQ